MFYATSCKKQLVMIVSQFIETVQKNLPFCITRIIYEMHQFLLQLFDN